MSAMFYWMIGVAITLLLVWMYNQDLKGVNRTRLLAIAAIAGLAAFAIDYLILLPGLTVLRSYDLEYLPVLLVIGVMFWLGKDRPVRLVLIPAFEGVVAALFIRFIAEKLIIDYGPDSALWSAIGPQVVYLFIPTFIALAFAMQMQARTKTAKKRSA